MNQMMLAILALLVGTLAMTQRQVAIARGDAAMIRNEVDMQAASVAKDHLDLVGTLHFDQATADTSAAQLSSAAQLTPAASFREEQAGTINDLDDFHGKAITVRRWADRDTLRFAVRTRVTYAVEASPTTVSATPTKAKRVTVVVRNTDGITADSVVLGQTFTCGAKCNW